MEKYNYFEQVKEDVRYFLNSIEIDITLKNKETLKERLIDEIAEEDNITGFKSNSYTCDADYAEDNLRGNWDLAAEAMEELCDIRHLPKTAEAVDVLIRCHLAPKALVEVLEELAGMRPVA